MLKRIRSIFLDNFLIKLFSVLFAVLLWMYASSRGQSEVNFVVPLELRDVPAGMMVVGDAPRPVDVRLRGDEVTIRNLSSKEVGASISLKGAAEGESLYNLSAANIKAPANVTITRVSPAELRIRLDSVAQKQLAVRARLTGKPDKGSRIAGVRTEPETVVATGPKGEVEELNEVLTEPVDVSGIVGGFERQVRLSEPGDGDISLDTYRVKLIVTADKKK